MAAMTREQAEQFQKEMAQAEFLRNGGAMAGILQHKYQTGELALEYEFQEFPKYINVPIGVREYARATEAIRAGRLDVIEWIERRDETCSILVQDADQEAEANAAIARAAELGLELQPGWNFATLLREVDLTERVAGGTARPRPRSTLGSPGDRALERVRELERELDEVKAARTAETAAAEAKQRAKSLPTVAPDPTANTK